MDGRRRSPPKKRRRSPKTGALARLSAWIRSTASLVPVYRIPQVESRKVERARRVSSRDRQHEGGRELAKDLSVSVGHRESRRVLRRRALAVQEKTGTRPL